MIEYQDILKAIALRAGQMAEGTPAAREVAYAGDAASALDGAEMPYSALKAEILAAEAEIAEMVGNSTNAIYRTALASDSAAIPSGGQIPGTDQYLNAFVGSFDGIFDVTTDTPLREQPLQLVQRRIAHDGTAFRIPAFWFAKEGSRIYHTVSNVYFRGCAWDRDTQETAFDLPATVPADPSYGTADVDAGTDTFTLAAHGFWTGLKHRHVKATLGTLPSPLVENTDYFFIVTGANTFKIATSYANALAGSAINLLGAGGNGNSITVVGSRGGGQSPLPFALRNLLVARTLSRLAQEGWFVQEAAFYGSLTNARMQEIIEGRAAMFTLPDIAIKQASVDAARN